MPMPPALHTQRLRLAPLGRQHLNAYAALHADAEVMRFVGPTLSAAQSRTRLVAQHRQLMERGFGHWAIERREDGEFIGCIGLGPADPALPLSACMEVAWVLARPHWSRGYATEAARACLQDGFERLGLEQVASFTAAAHTRGRRVMERLGLRDVQKDFMHPECSPGHPARRHCLYRMNRTQWCIESHRHASPFPLLF